MGNKRIVTIADYGRFGFSPWAQCLSCGHQAPIDKNASASSDGIERVRRRLRCSKCSSRRVRMFGVERGEFPPTAAPANP
ncbi:MAG: hypothetical protein KGL48_14050 [Sphingomonadales bacterium]|nr:hypothetical protein [Sphingomonadales bacterium]